jgi:hypothetical protein
MQKHSKKIARLFIFVREALNSTKTSYSAAKRPFFLKVNFALIASSNLLGGAPKP